ncbi:acyltransferase [Erwinia rhapontici]|uniref:acyltransferase n=1 Tax=Erwinia rhapontici TaxID=55212 RepID=UPI002167D84D|nr:acyltransferase family protein [Erwinia rhapontici]MCS3605342.1 surface polysaccharide O-acyltransferase-like enzyme [Erwinia rhapontici]
MRNNTLDIIKLIACLSVISLHVAGFPELPEWMLTPINLMARWAVPFFFLISGFYLASKDKMGVFVKIKKTVVVFLVASAIYLFFIFFNSRFNISSVISEGLGLKFFITGSYVHLWFLCALVYGCLMFSFFIGKHKSFFPLALAITIALSYWVLDVLNSTSFSLSGFFIFRLLLSFSMMWCGYIVAKSNHRLSMSSSIVIIALSAFLMIVEVYGLYHQFGFKLEGRQFPLFCAPMAYGIFMLSLAVATKNNILSKIGRDYSLGIYIVHYCWIYFFYYTLPSSYQTPSTIVIPLVLIASVLSLMFLKRYMNRIFRLMNGM